MTTAEMFPASELLADELAVRGWDVPELARRTGLTVAEVVAMTKTPLAWSARQTVRIAAALGTSIELLVRFQALYEEWVIGKGGYPTPEPMPHNKET